MKDMVQDLKQLGSILTEQDFRLYKPRVYDALSINLTGSSSTMYGVRPPGSGVILGFILNIMSGYKDLYPDKSKKSPEQASLFYHRLVEAFKYAYAKRTELGDEVFDDIAHLMDSLTDPKFVDTIRKTIDDDKTFETDHYGSIYHARDDHGTAHVSVIDAQGNAVSVTTTVNLYFGSMVISPKTGILFNDQMDDFAVPGVTNFFGLPPSAANRIKPQKRPLSSMCPTIVVDNHSGKVKLAVGGAGGTKITTAASIVALRNLLFGESIKEAIDAPRLHHQLNPNQVVYDEGFPEHVLVELARKGHKVVPLSGRASVIIGIARTQDGALQAAYDYKKNGSVDGY
ncbi:Glutathione hydrolase 1 proenzyme [Halotydeus destructor]|nr:Glutathione hydrolase 1 proenzyme [Halotydeus destructor]